MIILDGAMGTELNRRGIDTTLPLWSARALQDAPDIVKRIHRDYVEAGAQVITTNSFRTNTRTMQRAGLVDGCRRLTTRSVEIARAAAQHASHGTVVQVAGSLAPVEDCYSPQLVPSDAELDAEHGELAQHLVRAGCDLLLVETMNCIREASAAAKAARAVTATSANAMPLWISFTLAENNDLLSGEKLTDAVQAMLPFAPQAILINCVPVAQIASALKLLRAVVPSPIQIGAYGNVGHVDDDVGWTLTHAVSPAQYAAAAREWRELGATIIGGCCGTMPAHIQALSAL